VQPDATGWARNLSSYSSKTQRHPSAVTAAVGGPSPPGPASPPEDETATAGAFAPWPPLSNPNPPLGRTPGSPMRWPGGVPRGRWLPPHPESRPSRNPSAAVSHHDALKDRPRRRIWGALRALGLDELLFGVEQVLDLQLHLDEPVLILPARK
jgi:hypothetical protein